MNKYAVVGIILVIVIIAAYAAMQPQKSQQPAVGNETETQPALDSGDIDSSSSALQHDLSALNGQTQPASGQEILDV